MNNWIKRYQQNKRILEEHHLYHAKDEHDACGVGFVASIDGKPKREVVEGGINALKSVWHRGAVDADGKSGDGAGILTQIPENFFENEIAKIGHKKRDEPLGIGMIFLPRNNFAALEKCTTIIESELVSHGYFLYGWRQVPINNSVIGDKANSTRPEIEQSCSLII